MHPTPRRFIIAVIGILTISILTGTLITRTSTEAPQTAAVATATPEGTTTPPPPEETTTALTVSVDPQPQVAEVSTTQPRTLTATNPFTWDDLALGLIALQQLNAGTYTPVNTVIERSIGETADNLASSITNVSNSTLKLAGGTLTGALTTDALTVGGAATFSDNLSLPGTHQYLSFGTTAGATAPGLRESGGLVEYSNGNNTWIPISSAASVRYQLDEDGWELMDERLPGGTDYSRSIIIDDYIWMFGRSEDVNPFIWRAPVSDPTDWTDMETTFDVPDGAALIKIGDHIYFFGGANLDNVRNKILRAPVSDPTALKDTGATLPGDYMALPSSGQSHAIIGDYVYLFYGGGSIWRAPVSDPLSWEDTGAVSTAVGAIVVLEDYIWSFTGWYDGGAVRGPISRAPVSDPLNWEFLGSLPHNLWDSTGSVVIGDYVYLLGGYTNSPTDNIMRAPVSDPSPGSWTVIADAFPLNHRLGSVVTTDTHVYIFGGFNDVDTILRTPITTTPVNPSSMERRNAPTGPFFRPDPTLANIAFLAGNVSIGTTGYQNTLSLSSTTHATLGIGATPVSGVPTIGTVKGLAATGTNIPGGTLAIEAGAGTGTAGGGALIFRTAPTWGGDTTITHASTTSANSGSNTASTLSFTHTTGALDNGILVVSVAMRTNTPSVRSVTYNGHNLTKLERSARSNAAAELWYLVGPPEGTGTVTVRLSASVRFAASASTFEHVDGTTPFGTAVAATGSSQEATLDVSSATGELVIDVLSKQVSTEDITADGSQSTRWTQVTTSSATNNLRAGGSTKAGEATTTMSWTWPTTDRAWALLAAPLKPMSTTGGSAPTERLRITADGKIGIATTTPTHTLTVSGTVGFHALTGATGAGSLCLSTDGEVVYNAASDSCLPSLRDTKDHITPLTLNALDTITALESVSFAYINSDGRTRYGFIAEDVALVDPLLATYDADGILSGIDDRSLIALLIKAIQEIIESIARQLTTDRLCIGTTCISEQELKNILQRTGTAGLAPLEPEEPEEEEEETEGEEHEDTEDATDLEGDDAETDLSDEDSAGGAGEDQEAADEPEGGETGDDTDPVEDEEEADASDGDETGETEGDGEGEPAGGEDATEGDDADGEDAVVGEVEGGEV